MNVHVQVCVVIPASCVRVENHPKKNEGERQKNLFLPPPPLPPSALSLFPLDWTHTSESTWTSAAIKMSACLWTDVSPDGVARHDSLCVGFTPSASEWVPASSCIAMTCGDHCGETKLDWRKQIRGRLTKPTAEVLQVGLGNPRGSWTIPLSAPTWPLIWWW